MSVTIYAQEIEHKSFSSVGLSASFISFILTAAAARAIRQIAWKIVKATALVGTKKTETREVGCIKRHIIVCGISHNGILGDPYGHICGPFGDKLRPVLALPRPSGALYGPILRPLWAHPKRGVGCYGGQADPNGALGGPPLELAFQAGPTYMF
jgi:hypothetical protein